MKKNISAALLSLACFSAVSAAAFADGPVGRAINGIGRAGEDIVDGAGNAVDDIVDGVTGDGTDDDTAGDDITGDGATGDDTTGDNTTGDDNADNVPGGSDTPANDSDNPADDSSDITDSSDPSDSIVESPAASIDNSGAVGGINATNPGTGVAYGLTAAAAVLAAVGVVAASARKTK